MDSIILNGITYYKQQENGASGDKAFTFLKIGEIYLIRTVTMIYTGRLKAVSEQEFLFSDVAWIPETERWHETVATGTVRESEPYGDKDVVIGRGAILDVVSFPKLIKEAR
jgi:hypothetical protein